MKYAITLIFAATLAAQDHNHNRMIHGVPGGVPEFCAGPTTSSAASGAWSNPATWSAKKVPGAGDRVLVGAGHDVVYNVSNDATIACVELRGHLRFATDVNTRLKTNNLMVQDDGYLEIGSVANPIAGNVTAEVIVADQKIDRKLDPTELGAGIESLGKITMHGAVKTPTFMRLAAEPLAGQTALTLEQPVTSWKAGDRIVIPDTRQLRESQRGENYQPRDEKL
jgi:hypothetical protein